MITHHHYPPHLSPPLLRVKAARALYEKAFEIAPQNPVLLWAWTIFLLAENAHPRKLTWEAAQAALIQAKVYDEKAEKFEVAKTSFFHWSVVVGPTDAQSLLNWALVQQLVTNDYNAAEKFYRKAVDANPEDDAVQANYEDFLENRLPGGLYAGGGPGEIIRRRAQVQLDGKLRELPAPEWCQMRDPLAKAERFAIFYYNEASSVTRWEEPDWAHEWVLRRRRSASVRQIGMWEEMVDGSPVSEEFTTFCKFANEGRGKHKSDKPETHCSIIRTRPSLRSSPRALGRLQLSDGNVPVGVPNGFGGVIVIV